MIVKMFLKNDPTFSKKTLSKKMIVKAISLEIKSLLKKMLIVQAIFLVPQITSPDRYMRWVHFQVSSYLAM